MKKFDGKRNSCVNAHWIEIFFRFFLLWLIKGGRWIVGGITPPSQSSKKQEMNEQKRVSYGMRERESRAKQKRPGPLLHLCVSSFTHSLDSSRRPSFHVCVSICTKTYICILHRHITFAIVPVCRWMYAYIRIRLLNRCFELCIITKCSISLALARSDSGP